MKIGTKSILFGVHQFALHPLIVALAWWQLYGFPWDPRLWFAFFLHDLGYIGLPNMDGPEGEEHPEFGADCMWTLFDYSEYTEIPLDSVLEGCLVEGGWRPYAIVAGKVLMSRPTTKWQDFTLLHSRFYAKKLGRPFSRLCVADKLAIALYPRWLYLTLANLTGEIHEYMQGEGARTPAGERSQWQWLTDVQRYCRAWAMEHRDGKQDHWTGTKRDLALNER